MTLWFREFTPEKAANMRCCGPEGCGKEQYKEEDNKPQRYCIGPECMAWAYTTPFSNESLVGCCGLVPTEEY